jgi:hypothetical protein
MEHKYALESVAATASDTRMAVLPTWLMSRTLDADSAPAAESTDLQYVDESHESNVCRADLTRSKPHPLVSIDQSSGLGVSGLEH